MIENGCVFTWISHVCYLSEGVNVIPEVFLKSATFDEGSSQVDITLSNGDKVCEYSENI